MDPKIAMLMESLECSKEEAEMLLEAAEGDFKKAIEYHKMISKEYIAIALKIDANKISNFEGYFFILANGKKGDIKELDGAVVFKKQEDIDITVDWEAFKETINNLKKEPTFDSLETSNLIEFLSKNLNPSVINYIYSEYKKSNIREVREKLEKVLSDYFTEEIDFSYHITLLSAVNIQKEEKEKEKKTEEKKPIDIFVNVSPVVDPVKGKPVEKLTLGDRIYVKILEDKEISKSIGAELNRTVDGIENIVPCVLRKIEKTQTGSFELEVILKKSIIGKTVVKPEIRVKLVNPEEEKKDKNSDFSNMIYIYLAIGGILLLAIIIVILILK